ncbi:MAG: hypothetical protein ACNYPE_13470 [Candidatus Azotimanducaceae bacterium WSBS_2022_MAG_OTU7]
MSPTAAITADVQIDKLDVTAYLSGSPAKDTAGMTKPNTKPIAPRDSELIPVELLRDTRLKTIIRIDSLTLEGGALRNTEGGTEKQRKGSRFHRECLRLRWQDRS